MLMLLITSVFFVYSAQSYNFGIQWKAQIIWSLLGIGCYILVSLIDYKFYLRHAHVIYAICILLLLTLWTPLGARRYNALRWLDFGYFSLQPSETAKIGTLILACSILARSEISNIKKSITTLSKVGLAFAAPILLIFLQPDLGSSLVFPPMIFALLYVSNLSQRFFAGVFVASLILLSIVGVDIYGYHQYLQKNDISPSTNTASIDYKSWLPLKNYQRNRILSFAAPEAIDPQGIGVSWNLRQSLISIGSGGVFGKGHNKGTQAKLGYLPQSVATNDFIFSVLAEESGFVGGLFVITLYAILIGNNLRIGMIARDRFGMLLAVGVASIFMVHIFINIGMTIGIMPITGLPLPFLSYGGSFVIICCIMQGFVQSVYRYRKDLS